MDFGFGLSTFCFLFISVVIEQTVASTQHKGFAGQKQQRAVVYVDGNINADDHLTLSVTTAYASKTVRLRRVEHSVLHEQLTTFTVVGQTNGTPDLHWDTVSEGVKRKAKQFFYDLDTGAVVSIVDHGSGNTTHVKGFLDHETRISPAVASRRRGTGARLRRDSEDETQHTVWTQDDSVEWNILSRLGLSAKQLASRIGDDEDDDEDDYDHNFVHRDDYLEVPAIFRDKSLWIKPLKSQHSISRDILNDDREDFISFSDDKRRRRRRRQSMLDSQHNPFHTTFSSRLAALASFRPHTASGPVSSTPFSGTYIVEAMVMVDVKTYSEFNYDPILLEDYILHFWQVVNLRLRAITDPRLQLRIRSYGKILFSGFQQFIESSRVSTGSRRLVSLAGVIEGFRGWMQSYETNTMYSGHDVAILMTGENLCKLSPNGSCPDSPKGIGYMGGACITSRRFSGYTYDVAVAEVDRSYRGVLTATHELGHLLNASHDGEGGATACSPWSGYIMSYTWRDAVKFNRFSSCSKLSISKFLTQTWYSECLTEASDSSYAYRGQLPGRAMSLQEQCMHYNAGIPCSSRSLDSQCHNLCCENILKVSVSSEPAADGTVCGHGKSCFAGQCVLDHVLPSVPPL